MAKNDFFPSVTATMDVHVGARSVAGASIQNHAELLFGEGEQKVRPLPDDLERWLVGLRLLQRVPFHYIVPDARMLPPESVRVFYIDRTWTDRLIEGAMSAGAVSNGELELAQRAAARARKQLDAASGSNGEQVTGMILRSTLVRRWPRMEVRAYRGNARLTNLRVQRISEGILLVLWHGVPNRFEIEEPKHGVQFGVNPEEEPPAPTEEVASTGFNIEPRSIQTGEILREDGHNVEIPVRWRNEFQRASPGPAPHNPFVGGKRPPVLHNDGVLDIRSMASKVARAVTGNNTDPATPPMMALALQQMPFIQPFKANSSRHYPDAPPEKKDNDMWKGLVAIMPMMAAYYDNPVDVPVELVTVLPPVDVALAVAKAMTDGIDFINGDNS